MALTVMSLLNYTTAAQKPMSVGAAYSAFNEDEGWGVVSEEKKGKLTGRIGVICDDGQVLRGFITEARRLGHIVYVPRFMGPKNTVFVTLKH